MIEFYHFRGLIFHILFFQRIHSNPLNIFLDSRLTGQVLAKDVVIMMIEDDTILAHQVSYPCQW